jgi:hypothetical protein
MRTWLFRAGSLLVAALFIGGVLGASSASATGTSGAASGTQAVSKTAQKALPLISDCKSAPTPEVPGRGVVGFFESAPKTPPPAGDPFAPNSTTSIYEQYGYAGLRFNTYDLGCGPDLARSPDAAVGTAVANWIITLPKTAVAATGAILSAAFQPDFLGVFDPLISQVVDTLQRAVFEQWAFVVMGALGLLVIWRARQASLASTAGAIGWALLVMVLVTMVFRWPLVAGHAADETVTTTLGAVTGGLNDKAPGAASDAGTEATAGMHEALLYQSWLGGTFGDANSDVAKKYGPVIFDATALTWQQAAILKADPAAGKKIIDAKEKKFEDAAAKIKEEDPDAYEYLTGRRSDTRVGYAVLAGIATLCAVPFLFVAGLLVLGALIIVRFGVMLFPAFATLGLFPTMRSLVTGIGSTVAAALINAMVFGIGAAVTVLGMGVLLSPTTGAPPWLEVVLMLLLTIVMWVALRPFRRLTQMVSSRTNHFASASGGVTTVTRGAARASGRILTSAVGTFLGVSAAQRSGTVTAEAQAVDGPPQRSEASTSYQPVITAPGGLPLGVPAEAAPGAPGPVLVPAAAAGAPGTGAGVGAGQQAAALTGAMQINAGSVTVVGVGGAGSKTGRSGSGVETPGEIYAPAASAGSRSESGVGASRGGGGGGRSADGESRADDDYSGRYESSDGGSGAAPRSPARVRVSSNREVLYDGTPATDGARVGKPGDRGFQRPEGAIPDDFDLDELNEVFRPASARQP